MKVKMKILVEGTHDDEKFNNAISELESQGWKLDRQYGGTMPKFKGHGAEMSKNI